MGGCEQTLISYRSPHVFNIHVKMHYLCTNKLKWYELNKVSLFLKKTIIYQSIITLAFQRMKKKL